MSRLALSISDRSELMERLGHVGRVLKFQAIVTWSLPTDRLETTAPPSSEGSGAGSPQPTATTLRRAERAKHFAMESLMRPSWAHRGSSAACARVLKRSNEARDGSRRARGEPRTTESGEPDGHEAVLYFRETAGRDSDEFYANPEIGEFWTGPRPTAADVARMREAGVHTFLVGESFMRERDPGAALARMFGA